MERKRRKLGEENRKESGRTARAEETVVAWCCNCKALSESLSCINKLKYQKKKILLFYESSSLSILSSGH